LKVLPCLGFEVSVLPRSTPSSPRFKSLEDPAARNWDRESVTHYSYEQNEMSFWLSMLMLMLMLINSIYPRANLVTKVTTATAIYLSLYAQSWAFHIPAHCVVSTIRRNFVKHAEPRLEILTASPAVSSYSSRPIFCYQFISGLWGKISVVLSPPLPSSTHHLISCLIFWRPILTHRITPSLAQNNTPW